MLEVLTYAFDESSDSSDDEEVAVLFLDALWPPVAELYTAHLVSIMYFLFRMCSQV